MSHLTRCDKICFLCLSPIKRGNVLRNKFLIKTIWASFCENSLIPRKLCNNCNKKWKEFESATNEAKNKVKNQILYLLKHESDFSITLDSKICSCIYCKMVQNRFKMVKKIKIKKLKVSKPCSFVLFHRLIWYNFLTRNHTMSLIYAEIV